MLRNDVKQCTSKNGCGLWKDEEEFAKNCSICKSCKVVYNKKYFNENKLKNKQKKSEYDRIYRDDNKEKIIFYREEHLGEKKEYNDNYYLEKREEILEQKKERRKRDFIKVRERDRIYHFRNRIKRNKEASDYRKRNRGLMNFLNAKRNALKLLAIPKYVNYEKIKEIYNECRRLTLETGIEYNVDHIIPLQNELVCGLHIHNNLQILTKSQNCSKGNKFDVDCENKT